MIFREDYDGVDRLGEVTGYLFAYALFTAGLYAILTLSHRIPVSWSLLHVASISLAIAIVGALVGRMLR